MTILDRGASSKKEDNSQGRQSNYENGNRKQRSRAPHSARERAPTHSRSIPAPNVNTEYDFWAAAPMVHRNPDSPFDNDAAHLQEMNIRGHLKPKGLSKSGMSLSSASDAQSAVADSTEDQNSQLMNAVVPPTADLNLPSSSYSIKNLGRHGKKHIDKKVAHKKKHRRTVPYSQTGKITKSSAQIQMHRKVKSSDGAQGVSEDSPPVSSTYPPTTLLTHASEHQQFHNNHEAANRYCQYPSNSSSTVSNAVFPDHYSNRVIGPSSKNSRTSPILLNPEQTSSEHEKEDCDDINKDIKNNSDDECDQARLQRLHHGVDFKKLEVEFEEKLKQTRGFIIKPMAEDGACLFRAVADQVYGDQNMHDEVRKNCMNYMVKNADYFSNYVTEDFKAYIDRKRDLHAYGNNLEMQAMVELYNRPFEVYQYRTDPINTFQTSHPSANPPIRVSYHQNLHYNSVVDPHTATIGVGLGLPAFKPGHADKTMLNAAIEASCEVWEQQMLNDKVQATDWESTDDAILEQVARESYMEYMERKRTSEIQEVKPDCVYEKKKSPSQNTKPNEDIPKVEPSKIVKEFPKKNSRPTNPIDGDWVAEEDEWQVLSQVLANSQQEYMDALKHQATHSKATCSKYT